MESCFAPIPSRNIVSACPKYIANFHMNHIFDAVQKLHHWWLHYFASSLVKVLKKYFGLYKQNEHWLPPLCSQQWKTHTQVLNNSRETQNSETWVRFLQSPSNSRGYFLFFCRNASNINCGVPIKNGTFWPHKPLDLDYIPLYSVWLSQISIIVSPWAKGNLRMKLSKLLRLWERPL